MFEQIYQWPRLIEQHRQAPLRFEREQYLKHLLEHGYRRSGIAETAMYMLHIIRVLDLKELRVIRLEEIKKGANIWAEYRGPFRDSRHRHYGAPTMFMKVARNWFRFHDKLVPPPEAPFLERVQMFSNALRFHQGLAATTIRGYSNRAHEFLKWLTALGGDLRTVLMADIDEFLAQKRAEGWTHRSIVTQCNSLRSFFRFAELQGWCSPDLALGIHGPSVSKYGERPKGPSWPQVRQLVKLAEGTEPEQRRAKALLLILAVYGLRCREVMGLCLEDFDWRSEIFTVHRAKCGGIQQFPIQYEVGEAILLYLRHARPRVDDRHLFLGERRPWGALDHSAVWRTVSRRMQKLGIELDHMGAHSLRHACATRLLKKGASLQEIADFLGHRDMHSVSIYAKHDICNLRKVAAFRLAGLR